VPIAGALNRRAPRMAQPPSSATRSHSARPRIALMGVLVAAAVPVRISVSLPVVNSISVLDILLVLAAGTLALDLAFRPLDVGYRNLFWILSIPLVLSVLSIVWSHDRGASVRASLVYAAGLVAYLFVVRELAGLGPERVITYIKRYAYLLIIPGLLLLLRAPGFAPQEAGLDESDASYLSYYTRLSHPFIGRSNNLATVLAFFVPLLLYWGHARRDRRVTAAGVATLLAVFLTLSRGVLLAFLVAGVLYGLLTLGRRRAGRGGLAPTIAFVLLWGVVAVAGFYTVNPATQQYFATRFDPDNVVNRAELVSSSFTHIAANPLLGHGSGVSPAYEPTSLAAQETYLRRLRADSGVTPPVEPEPVLDVHNTYLQQVLYFGLPLGLLASLALVGTVAVFLARRRHTVLAGVIAYTLLVQLVIFLMQASFEGTVLRVLFYMSIGLAVGLLRSVERESRATASPVP
jgi:O-antigen ligase